MVARIAAPCRRSTPGTKVVEMGDGLADVEQPRVSDGDMVFDGRARAVHTQQIDAACARMAQGKVGSSYMYLMYMRKVQPTPRTIRWAPACRGVMPTNLAAAS